MAALSIPPKKRDYTGSRFGILTAIRSYGRQKWIVRCDCGTEKIVQASSLAKGEIKSCGCNWHKFGNFMELARSLRKSQARQWAAMAVPDGYQRPRKLSPDTEEQIRDWWSRTRNPGRWTGD